MIPGWMLTAGIIGWLIGGVAVALAVIGWFFTASASISIPLILAMVIGMVAYPACEWMTRHGVHKAAAAGIVLLLLLVVAVGVVWLVVAGVISQWPHIQDQIQKGLNDVTAQLTAWGFNTEAMKTAAQNPASVATTGTAGAGSSPLASGLLSSVGSALTASVSSIFSLAFGLFIALTLLFYVLVDFPVIATWVSRHMWGLKPDVGEGIVEDAVLAMRGYFRGTTITGLVVAVCIGAAMLIMHVPLAATVAVVTFLTCYIPFFGAIISGAFAFLIALGSNGFTTAIILLIVVLLTQNVLQTVINAKVMGESLNLHPLVVLVVTMLGGIFAGLLGAALGAPLAALFVNAGKRLAAAFSDEAEAEADAAAPS
jgi:predicted PurR-regulated permease PerM